MSRCRAYQHTSERLAVSNQDSRVNIFDPRRNFLTQGFTGAWRDDHDDC